MRTGLRCTYVICALLANLSYEEVFHPVCWEIPSPKGNYFFPVSQYTTLTYYSELKLNILFWSFHYDGKGFLLTFCEECLFFFTLFAVH
jgi:hypothetical protein